MRAQRAPGGILAVRFVLRADLGRLRIPARRLPRPRDGLWRHTCFEIFVPARSRAYAEYNLSPSGEWAAYAFSSYRRRAGRSRRPAFRVRRSDGTLVLHARVPAPASVLGLSAVIEERNGRLSYWALRHPRSRPDFHDRRGFALEVA